MGADSLHREKLHGLQVRAPIRTYPSPNPVLATQPIQTTMAVGLRPSFHGPRRNYGLIIPVTDQDNWCWCRRFVRALVCTGLLNLARDDQLPGEPAPLPRRVGHARHSDGLYPTQLGTTPQAHEVSCAHLLMCHGAAGCFQRCIGHGRRHFRGRCLPTPRREQILLTAIHTSSTRRVQNGQARSRCV